MSRSPLIVPSTKPDHEGNILRVTPESAGWSYVGFEVYKLAARDSLTKHTEDLELCAVLLSGKANAATKHAEFANIGQRMNVFEKTPSYSVYVPNDDTFTITALTELELALCWAPGAVRTKRG